MLPAANRVLVTVLNWGVRVSLVLLVAGLGLWWAAGRSANARMPALTRVPVLLLHGDPAGVLTLGVTLLMLTPVAAVASASAVYWRHRRVAPALAATIVLAILLTSIALASGV